MPPPDPLPVVTDAPALYRSETYAVDNSYGFMLRRVMGSLQRHLDRRLQPLDLTAMQLGPLVLLAAGKGNTAAQLARCLNIDTGAMTRMIDRLEAKGLLQRTRSNADRRVVLLELTPAGVATVDANAELLVEVLNLHLAGFTAAELAQLMGYLRRMLDNGAATDSPAD
jgi:DNA-binding MarR family transcriptional regulator